MDQEAMSALGICLGSQGIFEMVSDRMQLMQCADSPRAHIVTNYWNLATFTVFLQAEIVGMVGMEHDRKHNKWIVEKTRGANLGAKRFPHLVHFYASGRSTRPPALFVTECRGFPDA